MLPVKKEHILSRNLLYPEVRHKNQLLRQDRAIHSVIGQKLKVDRLIPSVRPLLRIKLYMLFGMLMLLTIPLIIGLRMQMIQIILTKASELKQVYLELILC